MNPNSHLDSENEESPRRILLCSQYGNGDMEVGWDWNSPKSTVVKKETKKLILSESPKCSKPTFRRYPSNNQVQNFEKLQEELKALKEQIAMPDNESCLSLSPLEEWKFKEADEKHSNSAIDLLVQGDINCNRDKDMEDIFNDSVDEELFLCTQKVETILDKKNKCDNSKSLADTNKRFHFKSNTVTCFNNKDNCSISDRNTSKNKLDDSLNSVLETFNDKDIEALTQKVKRENQLTESFYRANSDSFLPFVQTVTKVEFYRTQSFEKSKYERDEVRLTQEQLDEIEKKRLEALAKLAAKRKKEDTQSPIVCSPEEIEKKRLQALAKLKKRKEEVERKRKEALKKLEMNRIKKADLVKSTLTKRL